MAPCHMTGDSSHLGVPQSLRRVPIHQQILRNHTGEETRGPKEMEQGEVLCNFEDNICNWALNRVNGQSGLVQVKPEPSHLVIEYTGTQVYGQHYPYPSKRVGSGSRLDLLTSLVVWTQISRIYAIFSLTQNMFSSIARVATGADKPTRSRSEPKFLDLHLKTISGSLLSGVWVIKITGINSLRIQTRYR